MLVLGIETSCDETAAAVVEETGDAARPWRVRSSIVASQVDLHREWGGVVPELSARQHVRDICGVVERALDDTADIAHVLARRQLRHHAAPFAMDVGLRSHDVGSKLPPAGGVLNERRGRFVARRFNPEDQHWRDSR